MPDTTARTADAPTAEDALARERHAQKLLLVQQINVYKARREALTELEDEARAKLRLAMSADGDRVLESPDGRARFGQERCFKVTSVDGLIRAFDKRTLAENFKPSAVFVDAAAKAKIDITGVIAVGYDETFTVERHRSREARERFEGLVERAKIEARAAADAAAAKMRANRAQSGGE